MPSYGLGVDIGGVIIRRSYGDDDTSFHVNFLETPEVPHAIESIYGITNSIFGQNVYLVSKCGPKVEALTREWLNSRDFFQRSSIPSSNIRFCRKRDEKAHICESLGITHFVDDRLEVLSYLNSVENLYLFQPQKDEVLRFAQHLDRVHVVSSWIELKRELVPAD